MRALGCSAVIHFGNILSLKKYHFLLKIPEPKKRGGGFYMGVGVFAPFIEKRVQFCMVKFQGDFKTSSGIVGISFVKSQVVFKSKEKLLLAISRLTCIPIRSG